MPAENVEALELVVKAAKIVERETPENAVSLYDEKAADTVSITHSILP